MPIKISILPTALESGGPLEQFAQRKNLPFANPDKQPSFNNVVGSTNYPGPGFIASASRLTRTSNILPDGTFPAAFDAAIDQVQDLFIHVSPTSGSSVVRGGSAWSTSRAEFDPTYGLNVDVTGVELQEDVFETAVNEPVGAQFKANLQDLVTRGLLILHDQNGATMDPGDIADYTAP